MVSHLFFYQLTLIVLVWLYVMLQWAWLSDATTAGPTPPPPTPPRRKHSREPKPFAGLTTKPHCDACEHGSDLRPEAPHTPICARISISSPGEPAVMLPLAHPLVGLHCSDRVRRALREAAVVRSSGEAVPLTPSSRPPRHPPSRTRPR